MLLTKGLFGCLKVYIVVYDVVQRSMLYIANKCILMPYDLYYCLNVLAVVATVLC